MGLELWDDALSSFISLGVFAFFIVLLAFMAGILPLLGDGEQKFCAGLMALMMASAATWGLTEYNIFPKAVLGLSVWVLVLWAVSRIYKPPEEPP